MPSLRQSKTELFKERVLCCFFFILLLWHTPFCPVPLYKEFSYRCGFAPRRNNDLDKSQILLFSYDCAMQHHSNPSYSISVAFKGQDKDLIRKAW